ncbi:MAG: choice-of-anchor D domain-containing protein [Terriglobales bacterium]
MKFACCVLAACGLIFSAAAQDIVKTVIGGGPNGLPGVNANQYDPYQLAIDASGNVYVASYGLQRVFKISTSGTETIVAGTGNPGYSGDGAAAVNAQLYNPESVAVDTASPPNVYIADTYNCLVRKVNQSTGIITTIAGKVIVPASGNPYTSCGYNSDGGAANAAELYYPGGVAVNPSTSDVYIADSYNGAVRMVAGGSPTGTISTVAGTPQQNCQGTAPYGDAGLATEGHLCYPTAISLDTSVKPANIFITETLSRCTVREVVGSSGDIYQLAGSYTACGYNSDGGNAVGSELYYPYQTHVSVSGSTTTVEVADYYNARVRQFTLTYKSGVPQPGTISTIAGKGQGGWCDDDGGAALSACMTPVGIVYDSSGNYYISDYQADRVRKITKNTTYISTIDGWGPKAGTEQYYSDPVGLVGVGGTPSLYYPVGVYADRSSTKVYVGGYQGEAVYEWDSAKNQITGFAGSGYAGFSGDGGPASSVSTELYYPLGMGKDSTGNIYIADSANCAIREVEVSNGDITTVAGGSPGALKGCGYSNSGAVNSQFNQPQGVAFDSANNMYVADYYNCAIRKMNAVTTAFTTIAGGAPGAASCGYSGDGGPASSAVIYYPLSIALDAAGNVYFSQANNNCRIREIVAATGIIQTVAGDGTCGYTGDGPATGNSIYSSYVTADPNGNLFLSDYNNEILRWVTPTGQMLTFAGTPPGSGTNYGLSGDGGPALKATFYYPSGISRDGTGNTYVADEYNQRVRQITAFAGYGLSTANLIFETQPAGTVSDFQPVAVSAIGPTTISAISVPAGFSEIDDCVGQSLTAGQTCEIDVYFQPSAPGKISGNLAITSNAFLAANPNKIALNGTGAGLKLTGLTPYGVELLAVPKPETLTLTNSGASVNLSKIYLTSTTAFTITGGTCPVAGGPLGKGASCTIIVTFNPKTIGGFKSTLVILSNDPASPLLAQATGTGTEVELSTTSIAFGSISYGTTLTKNLTITNVGTASFTLSEAITPSGSGFEISSTGNTCTTSLAAGKNCTLPVEFAPTAVGAASGTLTLTTNGGSSPAITLGGTATSDVSTTPAPPTALAFGTITHGTTKTLNVTVQNVGTISSLTVSTGISGTGAADFTVLTTGNTCGSGVAAGKSCTLPVQFAPTAAASYSATLTVTTNGGQSPAISLTGTGD